MQEFNLDKKYITLMKGCLVAFLAFLGLGLTLPFFPEEDKGNLNGTLILTIVCTVVFSFFTILTWLTLKKLPYSNLVIDKEGIWYKHLGREQGLISWSRVSCVKERIYLQCLDLLDANGNKLVRVEYQLIGFESLRDIINAKIMAADINLNRTKFKKRISYHLCYLIFILVCSSLGLYVGINGNPMLGYGAMGILVALMIYEYAVTVIGVEIVNSSLEISYPIGKSIVQFSDITNIQILDTFHESGRFSEVWVVSKNAKKPFKLKQFDVGASMLFIVLRNAIQL